MLQARETSPVPDSAGICTEPAMLSEGVFIGQGRAKSGEKVFLRMERVTRTNAGPWQDYCQSTAFLTQRDRSLLTGAMRTIKKITDEKGEVRFINENYDEMAGALGYTREEFDDFINSLGKQNFFWARDNKTRINAVHNISAGAKHLRLDAEAECYVAYASKTPDFRMPPLRTGAAPFAMPTLKEYGNLYGDLLICVGLYFPLPGDRATAAEICSKGMFRNPVSFLAKTHKGLSMVLRSFSGAVVHKYFPGVESLECTPLASMQYQISSSLHPGDYQVRGYSHAEALGMAEEMLRDGEVYEIGSNRIKISALDRFYRQHAAS